MPEPAIPQGGAPAPAPAASAPPAQVHVTTQETDEFVTRLIGRHGNALAALTRIAGEQLRFRRRAQAAEKEAADLRAKMPAADAVVLTGDEAKSIKSLKDKGVDLTKVSGDLESYGTLKAEVAKSKRLQDLQVAAGDKYDLKVLTTLLGDTPLEFKPVNVMKEDKSGVETINVPYVVLGKGDTQTREALETYLEREHAGFKEALIAKENVEGSAKGEGKAPVVMPKQTTGAPAAKGKNTEVDAALKRTLSAAVTPSARKKAAAGG